MEKYLPEWFNEDEFETFLSEGPLTRQAWIKGIKRWRRTRFMLKQMLGKTPMKYISRAMRSKHAIMARTAVQNARDIQAAQDREEKMDAARNFIRQEDVTVDFGKLLAEKLFGGSQTAFSLGTKSSAGERASMRNPTGDPKKQARLKKRFQREDDRKNSHQTNESFIFEENKKSSSNQPSASGPKGSPKTGGKKLTNEEKIKKGDLSPVVVIKTKDGKVKIASRDSLASFKTGYKILKNKKPGEIKSPGDLMHYIAGKEGKFERTETYNVIFNNKPVEEVLGIKKDEEEPRKREQRSRGSQRKQQKKDDQQQKSKVPPVLPPERQTGPTVLPYDQNENAPQLAQYVDDPETTERLQELGWFGKDGRELEAIQREVDSNPWMTEAGRRSRAAMLSLAKGSNPVLSSYKDEDLVTLRIGMMRGMMKMSKLYEKMGARDTTSKADYVVFPKEYLDIFAKYISGQKIRSDLSKLNFAGKEKLKSEEDIKNSEKLGDELIKFLSSQKTDMGLPKEELKNFVAFLKSKSFEDFSPENAQALLEYLKAKRQDGVLSKEDYQKFSKYLKEEVIEEELPEELLAMTFGISHKAGKSQLASSALTETIAVIEDVKEMLGGVLNEIPPELMELIQDFNRLKNSMNGQNAFKILNTNFGKSKIQKMSRGRATSYDARNQSNLVAAQEFFNSSNPIVKEIKEKIAELMKNRFVQAAFVYAFGTGKGKFDKNSLGVAQGIFFADERGEAVGSMMFPTNFADAIRDPKFMKFAASHKMNSRAKSWGSDGSRTISPFSSRVEMGRNGPQGFFSPQNLIASYDPLADRELDNLFEYTFLPPDQTVSVESPPSSEFMPPLGSDTQFAGFSQNDGGEFEFTLENILPVLAQLGLIQDIDFDVLDYTELGMKLSSMQNPIKNVVTVNGREYAIPVFDVELAEELFNSYDNINETVIEMLNDGLEYEDAVEIFKNEISSLLEGKRNYKREYRLFHGKPEQRAKRSKRVLARRKMAKKLGKNAIKGKDIDHKDGNALNNGDSNLRVRSINKNRADNGHSKKKISEMWGAGLEGSGELTAKWLKQTPGQWQMIDPKLLKLLLKNKGKSR